LAALLFLALFPPFARAGCPDGSLGIGSQGKLSGARRLSACAVFADFPAHNPQKPQKLSKHDFAPKLAGE
jgi:hypothetical protein